MKIFGGSWMTRASAATRQKPQLGRRKSPTRSAVPERVSRNLNAIVHQARPTRPRRPVPGGFDVVPAAFVDERLAGAGRTRLPPITPCPFARLALPAAGELLQLPESVARLDPAHRSRARAHDD